MTDRELDAWLAEHLFGWRREADGCLVVVGGHSNGYHVYPGEDLPPRWSSTGGGMLAVIEKMLEKGWVASIFRLPLVGEWEAEFEYQNVVSGNWLASSPSLPRAVAEAAKKASEASA